MNNDKILEDLLARVQKLEDKVEVLSKKVGVEPAKESDGQKRCLPGFNECKL